jgi:hypothetical protein
VELIGNVKLFQKELSIPSFLGLGQTLDRSTYPNDIGSVPVQFLLSKEVCECFMKAKIHAIDQTSSTFCHSVSSFQWYARSTEIFPERRQ